MRSKPCCSSAATDGALLLLGRLGHQHVGFHFLAAAALTHAAHGGRIQVVAADGEPAVGAHGGALVGHVHALPADFRTQPDVDPGVAGGVTGVAGVEIAADVACRHSDGAGGGDVHVSVILANAFAALEGDGCAVLDVAGTGLVAHGAEHGFGEGEGAGAWVADGVQDVVCERAQLVVGGGELGGGEIGERGEGAVVLASFGVDGLDHAAHDDLDFAVRLFDGEEMRDIAVGIDLLETPAGSADGPTERALAQVAARREVQTLYAVFDGALVAVTGLVPNVHLHGLTPPPGVTGNPSQCGRRDRAGGPGTAREIAAGRLP